MTQLLCYSWLAWLLKQVNEIINRRVNYTYCEDKWNFVLVVQGENILISDHYWNSHGYYLHYSDIALYKMKICKDTPKPLLETLTWRGKREVKQTVKPFSWRATGTIWLHTSQSVCQTVYNMHTWRGTKLKMSHCWGLMQICLLQKLFKLAVLMYK